MQITENLFGSYSPRRVDLGSLCACPVWRSLIEVNLLQHTATAHKDSSSEPETHLGQLGVTDQVQDELREGGLFHRGKVTSGMHGGYLGRQ